MTAPEIQRRITRQMRELRPHGSGTPAEEFDFSTPEAEEAIRAVAGVLLEIRQDVDSRLARKVRLYERTFGLAVIPVLIRRAIKKARRRSPLRRRKGG